MSRSRKLGKVTRITHNGNFIFECGCKGRTAKNVRSGHHSVKLGCPKHGGGVVGKELTCIVCGKKYIAYKTGGGGRRYCPECRKNNRIKKNRLNLRRWRSHGPIRQYNHGTSLYYDQIEKRIEKEKKRLEKLQSYYQPDKTEQKPLLHSWTELHPSVDLVLDKFNIEMPK